jgi:hypothetical protein
LGELACIGLFAKIPNAAKHSHLGQVTPSHTKSRQVTCHLPDVVVCMAGMTASRRLWPGRQAVALLL